MTKQLRVRITIQVDSLGVQLLQPLCTVGKGLPIVDLGQDRVPFAADERRDVHWHWSFGVEHRRVAGILDISYTLVK